MKVLVYQGYNEMFRVRVVNDDDATMLQDPTYFPTKEAATEKANEYGTQFNSPVEVRDSIADVAAREAAEASTG